MFDAGERLRAALTRLPLPAIRLSDSRHSDFDTQVVSWLGISDIASNHAAGVNGVVVGQCDTFQRLRCADLFTGWMGV